MQTLSRRAGTAAPGDSASPSPTAGGLGPAGPDTRAKDRLAGPIALAATWDVEAARTHGDVAGGEAVLLGNLLIESPDINIARTPHNGRTFESFGEDPFLSGRLAAAYVQGVQSHPIIANVKHYAGNNQEQIDEGQRCHDERTLRELYCRPSRRR